MSCFDHSVLVSRISWRICRALGLDERAAARGGLLHDLYLYNWREKSTHPGVRHGTEHPAIALANARGPLPPDVEGGGHHRHPHVPLHADQILSLSGVGGGEHGGQAVRRRRGAGPGAALGGARPLPATPEAHQGCTP